MKNNRIRLTESQLHNVIKESIKNVLTEGWPDDSYGAPGDSATSSRLSSSNDKYDEDEDFDGRHDGIWYALMSLIPYQKTSDGYRVLIPPHFGQQMKELENNGLYFSQSYSNYTPVVIYADKDNQEIKNRLDRLMELNGYRTY